MGKWWAAWDKKEGKLSKYDIFGVLVVCEWLLDATRCTHHRSTYVVGAVVGAAQVCPALQQARDTHLQVASVAHVSSFICTAAANRSEMSLVWIAGRMHL